MRFLKLTFLLSTLLLLFSFAVAQTLPTETNAEKEKKKKELDERIVQILDQSIVDAGSLRLPENRAVVYALSGDLYWKLDEKRSRELFRNAAGEINAANQDAEREKRESTDPYYVDPASSNDIRGQILPMIATHDAELALELLFQTRPASLAEAMQKAAQPNASQESVYGGYNPDTQRVQNEISLEQRFVILAAQENPESAIKALKDMMAKGLSTSVLPLLQTINKKDEKKAGELAADVIKKLVDTDLTKKDQDLRTALSFLQFGTQPDRPNTAPGASAISLDARAKPFKFTDIQVRDLANKMVDSLMLPTKSTSIVSMMNQAIPILEKVVPERIALLKQRQAENQKNLPANVKSQQQMQQLWDPRATPEDILAQIPKLQNDMDKSIAYQAVSAKIGQIDDEVRAKKLIDQIADGKVRAAALEQFESAQISRSVRAGKLDDARKLIGNLTKKKTQIQQLVALATQFQRKGGEKDIESANSLMKDAKLLVSEPANDEDELNDLMEVVKGYALIDPDVAFRMFEPVIDQINEIIYASAILSKYNKRSREFKKGELVMKMFMNPGDSMLFYRFIPQMQMLGKADFERMGLLADRFNRGDSRELVKLFVLQGFMKEDRKPPAPGATSGVGTVVR